MKAKKKRWKGLEFAEEKKEKNNEDTEKQKENFLFVVLSVYCRKVFALSINVPTFCRSSWKLSLADVKI
jgi:hypothetical protein